MAEMQFSARAGDDQTDDSRGSGAMAVGVLLVGIGVAMLAERLNLVTGPWRQQIWPVLLIAFGLARLLQPRRRGRRGLFYVLAGAWWLAGLSGWLSFEQTWPLLIIAYGAGVVLEAVTSQPGVPSGNFPRRHSGGMAWVLTAILVGSFISAGGGRDWSRMVDPNGQFRSVALAGRTEHHVQSETFRLAEVVTVMGRNTIDLRDLPASAPSTVTVDGVTAMGTTIIRVPPDWTVDLKAVAIIGRAKDTHRTGSAEASGGGDWTPPAGSVDTRTSRRLVVRGAVLMGTLAVTP